MDGQSNGTHLALQHIPLSYTQDEPEESALRLVYFIRPKWREDDGPVEIVRFTDGITNTLLKLVKKRKDWSEEEQDNESILMRAYGNNTDILIDRDREARSHGLLSERGLAPELVARFENGLLYRFIRGTPSKPEDLIKEPIWRAVAKRLGEWHARLPVTQPKVNGTLSNGIHKQSNGINDVVVPKDATIEGRFPSPNMWTVMQKWVSALSTETDTERSQKDMLQDELLKAFSDLDSTTGLGTSGFIFGHCDLLCGNVIIEPHGAEHKPSDDEVVSFIDYEYATPCPAAFDIANHFAEWGGFDCDYNMLPTKSVRRAFLKEYLQSFLQHSSSDKTEGLDFEKTLDQLAQDVDNYRGMPGFYWGIWALIQSKISQIDFDYGSYAKVRLAEYWNWRDTEKGNVKNQTLREKRWAQES